MSTVKHPSYRRKDLFLVPGLLYEVTTRPNRGTYMELAHPSVLHYFEQGTIVRCTSVHKGVFGHLNGILIGDFFDVTSGMDQTLSVMDVKRIK